MKAIATLMLSVLVILSQFSSLAQAGQGRGGQSIFDQDSPSQGSYPYLRDGQEEQTQVVLPQTGGHHAPHEMRSHWEFVFFGWNSERKFGGYGFGGHIHHFLNLVEDETMAFQAYLGGGFHKMASNTVPDGHYNMGEISLMGGVSFKTIIEGTDFIGINAGVNYHLPWKFLGGDSIVSKKSLDVSVTFMHRMLLKGWPMEDWSWYPDLMVEFVYTPDTDTKRVEAKWFISMPSFIKDVEIGIGPVVGYRYVPGQGGDFSMSWSYGGAIAAVLPRSFLGFMVIGVMVAEENVTTKMSSKGVYTRDIAWKVVLFTTVLF